jgi:hypothetical protein
VKFHHDHIYQYLIIILTTSIIPLIVVFWFPDKIINLFYNDAFYYFTIAENFNHTGIFTFDGINPTNGFHPLWQMIVTIVFSVTSNHNDQVLIILILCLALTIFANLFIYLSTYKLTKSKLLSFVTVLPGYFYLLFGLAVGKHYSIISTLNGMETSLSLLLFSIVVYQLVRLSDNKEYSNFQLFSISLLLSLLVMSRLDEIFIVIPVFLFIFFNSSKPNKITILTKFLGIPILIVSGYLVYNIFTIGMMLPVSGMQKSGFSFDNVQHIIRGIFLGRSFNYFWGEHLYSRILPIVYVLIVSGLFVGFNVKRLFNKIDTIRNLLTTLGIASILKVGYHLFFTNLWDQGQWYYNIDIVTSNVIVSFFIFTKYSSFLKIKYISIYSAILLLFALCWNTFTNLTTETSNENFWKQRNAIKKEILKIDKSTKIIEMDDGIVTYGLGFQGLSGFGLCMDKEAFKAKNAGKLFDLAYKRGYRYIASLNYFKNPDNIPNSLNHYKDFVSIPFFALEKQDHDFWQFQLIYSNNLTGFVLIKFEKK